jgi:hypothetical protein
MDNTQLIQAITRAIIAVIIVGGCAYAVATGVSIPTEAWGLAGIVIGGLFGADALIKYARSKGK